MTYRISVRRSIAAIILAATAGCKDQMDTDPTASSPKRNAVTACPDVDFVLELAGPGLANPRAFTYRELGAMEMVRLDEVLMRKSHEDDETTHWIGPAIGDLLERCGLKEGDMILTLEAADGYEIEASLADMKDAVVALQNGEGRWLVDLDADLPVKLVPPHLPGNFWVMNPTRIHVALVTDKTGE